MNPVLGMIIVAALLVYAIFVAVQACRSRMHVRRKTLKTMFEAF